MPCSHFRFLLSALELTRMHIYCDLNVPRNIFQVWAELKGKWAMVMALVLLRAIGNWCNNERYRSECCWQWPQTEHDLDCACNILLQFRGRRFLRRQWIWWHPQQPNEPNQPNHVSCAIFPVYCFINCLACHFLDRWCPGRNNRGLNPRANYTERATAACRRS
jgi:hypothetical protein